MLGECTKLWSIHHTNIPKPNLKWIVNRKHKNTFIFIFDFSFPPFQSRSQIIVTYAICGFSHVGSIGVLLGGLAPLVPDRLSEISSLCVRALVSACIACFMTACVAGELTFMPFWLNLKQVLLVVKTCEDKAVKILLNINVLYVLWKIPLVLIVSNIVITLLN